MTKIERAIHATVALSLHKGIGKSRVERLLYKNRKKCLLTALRPQGKDGLCQKYLFPPSCV